MIVVVVVVVVVVVHLPHNNDGGGGGDTWLISVNDDDDATYAAYDIIPICNLTYPLPLSPIYNYFSFFYISPQGETPP